MSRAKNRTTRGGNKSETRHWPTSHSRGSETFRVHPGVGRDGERLGKTNTMSTGSVDEATDKYGPAILVLLEDEYEAFTTAEITKARLP